MLRQGRQASAIARRAFGVGRAGFGGKSRVKSPASSVQTLIPQPVE